MSRVFKAWLSVLGHATFNDMVKHYSEQLDRTFFALSDPTRRAIIGNLAGRGECSVLELAEPFALSLPAISKHIKLLENANLVKRRVEGRVHYLSLAPSPMEEATNWLTVYSRFWNAQLSRLEDFLQEEEEEAAAAEAAAEQREEARLRLAEPKDGPEDSIKN
ncbi:MAG: metalloregulator ArsR/SmtB family transcription factor [Candidatus Melainabacteria bacterium]|nr:metalloregulator ArsR/SmtB family transcription factor [Candidatus Melainabacteria bacterium]OPZ88443.1 MAG: Transcriptional repressor SdpR [bacterium ADurb.Bin425]